MSQINYNDTDELIRFEHQTYLNSLLEREKMNAGTIPDRTFATAQIDERVSTKSVSKSTPGRFAMKRKKEVSDRRNIYNIENDIICIDASDIKTENVITIYCYIIFGNLRRFCSGLWRKLFPND
jgi:hypothetical protein